MESVTVKEFGRALDCSIEKGIKRAILALGPAGVGKSDIVRSVAARHAMNVIDVRLLTWALSDIKGIPVPDAERQTTQWLTNSVFPQAERDGKCGILLLEELLSAPRAIQAAAYQLTLDRRVGDYCLPDGWIIVATGNRECDDGVFVKMPAPLADRFEMYEIRVDFPCWKEYAIANGVDPLVLGYLSFNPEALHTFKPDSDDMMFATPRSWVAVSDLFRSDIQDTEVLRMKAAANVGVEAAAVLEFAKYSVFFGDLESILNGSTKSTYPIGVSVALQAAHLLVSNLLVAHAREIAADFESAKPRIENAVTFIGDFKVLQDDIKLLYLQSLLDISSEVKDWLTVGTRNQTVSKILQEMHLFSNI